MVHLVWIGGTGVLPSILSSLILKVYHAFAFKPITTKFGKFTNFCMLFQMTCPIFNSIDTEYLYQEKICSYPVPCSFRTWPIDAIYIFFLFWHSSSHKILFLHRACPQTGGSHWSRLFFNSWKIWHPSFGIMGQVSWRHPVINISFLLICLCGISTSWDNLL